MIDAKETEELIGFASTLREDLDGLTQAFRKLLELMEAEHEAIKVAHLSRLEALTEEKAKLGFVIEKCSESIFKSAERIRIFYESCAGARDHDGMTAKDVGEWLQHICGFLSDKTLAAQILQRVTQSVIEGFDGLRDLKKKSQQKIEMNSFLTRKLLDHHQANIRLWLEMIAEFEATYSPKGEAKAPQAKSVLQVKA